MAMIEDLKNYRIDEINIAFKIWRQENEKLPTPAGILKIIKSRKHEERQLEKKFSDFDGDWPAYKKYLRERGLLNSKLSA